MMIAHLPRRALALFLLSLPSICAAIALIAATPSGIGLYPDSVTYILAARNLLHGSGLSLNGLPITWFPPLYPALLAAPGALGFDPYDAARWIQCALFAFNIFWIGAIAYRYSSSLLAAFLTAFSLLGAVDMITYHASAMSEGAFLFFSLPALLTLDLFLEHRQRRMLVFSALLTAAAAFTRTVGLAWLAGWTVLLLFRRDISRRTRVTDASIFALIGALPTLAWSARNVMYHSPTGRSFDVHAFLSTSELQSLIHTFTGWFFQWRITDSLWAVVPLVAAAPFVVLWIRSRQKGVGNPESAQPMVLVVSAASYLLFLIIAAAFFQADLFRDSTRMLLPLHALTVIMIAGSVRSWLKSFRSRIPVIAAGAGFLLICTFLVVTGIRQLQAMSSDGQGYASRKFRDSPLLKKIDALPPRTDIYANLVLPISFYTGRFSHYIPSKIVNSTQRPNDEYDSEMDHMAADMRSGAAVIVYFKRGNNWFVQPSIEEIRRFVPLRVIDDEADGWIYGAATMR